ncbi:helix-turn-helix transcriptional regulator [Tropicibacter sp. Alg240-R139]|uniref:helix-turn-helix transcriptional regulator n=1 Tax=Tropicibacter sp. Alg240-R139 TaxID=2305991 RepID=UPI003593864E
MRDRIREAASVDPELSPIFVPLKEAPKWFGVSRHTIYRQRKKGKIKIYKAGGRSVLKVSEVQRWIEDSYDAG